MERNDQRRPLLGLLEVLNIGLGIWLLASPYLLTYPVYKAPRINDALVAGLIIGWAITRLATPASARWVSLGNVILGLWVAISPFVLMYTNVLSATINNIIVGLLVALFAAAGFVAAPGPSRPAPSARQRPARAAR